MPPNEHALLRAIIGMAIMRFLGMAAGIVGAIAMGLSGGEAMANLQSPDTRFWFGLASAVVGLVVYVFSGDKLRQLKSKLTDISHIST